MTSPLKIVFAGTPDFAAHHLQALINSRHQLVAVYSQPDRPAGRGKKLKPSPVKQLAEASGLPVLQPVNFKTDESVAELASLHADVMVVVAYGLILPQVVLDTPRLGCINVHASLLPRWRGAAPIQRAVEAGDAHSGVAVMQMEAGLDTGPVITQAEVALGADETGGSLHDKLQELGAPALISALDQLAAGTAKPRPQDHSSANYAHKIDKTDLRIDWRLSAVEIERRIRAFNPFPVCFSELNDERIKILTAEPIDEDNRGAVAGEIVGASKSGIIVACGSGQLVLTQLQLPGKKSLPVADVLNGHSAKFAPGLRFLES